MDLVAPPADAASPFDNGPAPTVVAPPVKLGDLPQVTPQLFTTASSNKDVTASSKGTDEALLVGELTEWRKRFDDVYGRLEASLAQTSATAHAQDEDMAQFKLAAQTRIDQLALLRESLQADVARLSGSERALQHLVQQRDERIRDLEQENYALRMKAAQCASEAKQCLARATSAEVARRISEVRQQELQVSSQHAIAEVDKLRARLLKADEATRDSLIGQLTTFETLRQSVVDAFTARESALVAQMNQTVASVHGGLRAEVHAYCAGLKTEQDNALARLNDQLAAFCEQRDRQFGEQLAHYQHRCSELERERQQLKERCDGDIRLHTEQCKRREDQLLHVIAEREQALIQREAKLRHEQESQQRALSAQWVAKEAELTAKHDAAMEALRDEMRKDMTQQQTSFLDQIQKLSDTHLAAEQAWQERHQERERALAQSLRPAAVQPSRSATDNAAAELARRTSESSFLSKFDAIEARQRQRAEQVRSTLLRRDDDGASHGASSTLPDNKE